MYMTHTLLSSWMLVKNVFAPNIAYIVSRFSTSNLRRFSAAFELHWW
jgi:hypothetical protein